MLHQLKNRIDGQSVAVAAAIVMLFAVVGCGGKKSATDGVATEQRPVQTGVTTTPESTSVVPEIAVPVNLPEEPRLVTYEDAEEAYNDRQYSDAVELFTAYTERKPENPWGYYMLGLSARHSGDAGLAITAFENALELDSLHARSWLNLSRAQLDAGEPQSALDSIERGIALSGESSTTLRLQGRAFHQLGEIEDAIAAYRQAIIFDNEDVWSMNNLALVYIEEARFKDAVPVLARAIEISGEVPVFHNNLGMALENAEQYRAAEGAYQAAVDIDGAYEKASVNLSRVSDVEQDVEITPVDLEVLADNFEQIISEWMASAEGTEMIDNKGGVVEDDEPSGEKEFDEDSAREGAEEVLTDETSPDSTVYGFEF